MFGRLVRKELLNYLLDFRFIAVFGLCALLSALSVGTGVRNHARQLQDYAAVSESNRRTTQGWLEQGNLNELSWVGYSWNRRPEVLSPLVYGLSGTLGQQVVIQYERPPRFEASLFETDPIHALFGVLDLAFVVRVLLSLAVLLFTYDAICGEKEGGTLRLHSSYPVARSTLALAKLFGSTAAVLIPLAFAFLLGCTALLLPPGRGIAGGDVARVAVLMGVFWLYLTVFGAFGLFLSALTHRRLTAFLGLMGLWTVWLFVIPNLGVRTARILVPAGGGYDLERQSGALRWEVQKEREAESDAYWKRNVTGDWDALPETRRRALREGDRKIQERWDAEFRSRLNALQSERRNRMRRQQALAMVLSAISPLGAVSFATMDLARTGPVQQEQIEDALNAHLIYLSRFIREKEAQPQRGRTLTDFSPFIYRDEDTLGACLSRNLFPILNLALLAVLGFAGAYVAILRYDVR